MPYDPGISYHGDQYIAAGISKLGDVFSGAIDKTEDLRKRAALNDAVVSHALNNGRITQEEYNKYVEAAWGKKEGIANGIMANMHDDWQRQQFEAEEKDKALQRALSLQIAQIAHAGSGPSAAESFVATPEMFQQAKDAGGALVQVGKGHYQFVKGDGGPDAEGKVHIKPAETDSGEAIPGKYVVTKEGSNALNLIDKPVATPGSVVSGDGIPENTFVQGQKAGQLIKLDAKTTRRLNADAAGPAPTPTPSYMQRFMPAFLGGGTPAPAATPSQTPVPAVVAPAPVNDGSGFIKGKKYKDAQGNISTYLGNGQWQ